MTLSGYVPGRGLREVSKQVSHLSGLGGAGGGVGWRGGRNSRILCQTGELDHFPSRHGQSRQSPGSGKSGREPLTPADLN